jgi:hypothetical protein
MPVPAANSSGGATDSNPQSPARSGVWKRSYGRLTKAPPDERGGNRHGRPNATAPHPDSTRTGRSKRHARFLSGFAFGLIARVAQLAVLAGGSPLGPCLGSGRFLLTRSFTSGNLRLSEDRLIRQKAIGAAADDFRNRVERRSSPSPWRTVSGCADRGADRRPRQSRGTPARSGLRRACSAAIAENESNVSHSIRLK